MGAGAAKQGIRCHNDFMVWQFEEVESAKRRMGALAGVKQDSKNRIMLSRRLFWEVFTNMERVHKDKFVQLSLDVFDVFKENMGNEATVTFMKEDVVPPGAKARDKTVARRVAMTAAEEARRAKKSALGIARHAHAEMLDGMEVLLMLALFCKGDMLAQLKFCFDLFDLDNSNSMDLEEMHVFLSVLSRGAAKMRIIPLEPPDDQVEEVARTMFKMADVHEKGTEAGVSAAEFVRWARENVVSAGIIDSVKSLKHAAGEHDPQKLMSEKMAKMREKRMASKLMMEGLQSSTNFNVRELKFLRKAFTKKLGLADADDVAAGDNPTLTEAQFMEVMQDEYPAFAENPTVATMLFSAFDTDSGGTIDFKEFSVGMSKLTKGTLMEKVTFLFEVYDSDGSGSISVQELLNFVQREQGELVDELSFAEEVISALDSDNDGTISRMEFTSALQEDPVLFECFNKALMLHGVTREMKEGFEPLLQHTDADFSLTRLKRIWDRSFTYAPQELARAGPATIPRQAENITCAQFVAYMDRELVTAGEYKDLWRAVFGVFDSSLRELVNWRELFTGLAQVARGEPEEKASLYFTLYDTDGNGTMEGNEIMRLIMSSQQAMNDNAAKVMNLLKVLDKDGDGEITFKEFETALRADPETLQIIGHFFGQSETTEADDERAARLKQEELERVIKEVTTLFHPGRESDSDEDSPAESPLASGPRLGFATVAKIKTTAKKKVQETVAQMKERNERAGNIVVNSAGKRVVTKAERGPHSDLGRGLQKLRRLSLHGLTTAVTALQGLATGAKLEWKTVNDIDLLPQYTLPPASIAAKELTRQISMSIKDDRRELVRTQLHASHTASSNRFAIPHHLRPRDEGRPKSPEDESLQNKAPAERSSREENNSKHYSHGSPALSRSPTGGYQSSPIVNVPHRFVERTSPARSSPPPGFVQERQLGTGLPAPTLQEVRNSSMGTREAYPSPTATMGADKHVWPATAFTPLGGGVVANRLPMSPLTVAFLDAKSTGKERDHRMDGKPVIRVPHRTSRRELPAVDSMSGVGIPARKGALHSPERAKTAALRNVVHMPSSPVMPRTGGRMLPVHVTSGRQGVSAAALRKKSEAKMILASLNRRRHDEAGMLPSAFRIRNAASVRSGSPVLSPGVASGLGNSSKDFQRTAMSTATRPRTGTRQVLSEYISSRADQRFTMRMILTPAVTSSPPRRQRKKKRRKRGRAHHKTI